MAHPPDHQRVPSMEVEVARGGGSSSTNLALENEARSVSATNSVSVSVNSLTSFSSSHHSSVAEENGGGETRPVEGREKVNNEEECTVSPSHADSTVTAASLDTSSGIGVNGSENNPSTMPLPQFPVAEFLFQLTKMLTDSNSDYIEWRNASIFVHDPPGLERAVLPNYYRHSNYSSFQRQMNYFGFRKIAGKGKMAPCSYVNEHATEDISSLLFIKRKKAGISSAAAKLMAQQHQITRSLGGLGGVGISGSSLGMIGCSLGGVGNDVSMGGIPNSFSLNDQQLFAQLQQAQLLPLANAGIQATGDMSNVFLTTDQGNVFTGSKNNNIHINGAAASESYLSQGGANMPQSGFSVPEKLVRLDSAANLRALINQQISMFSTPGDSLSFPTMNSVGGLGNQLPLAGIVHGQAPASLPNTSAPYRGLMHGWNLSPGTGVCNDTIDINRFLPQLGQHLLQGSTNAEPSFGSITPTYPPFNLNGITGLGTSNGGQQGFQS